MFHGDHFFYSRDMSLHVMVLRVWFVLYEVSQPVQPASSLISCFLVIILSYVYMRRRAGPLARSRFLEPSHINTTTILRRNQVGRATSVKRASPAKRAALLHINRPLGRLLQKKIVSQYENELNKDNICQTSLLIYESSSSSSSVSNSSSSPASESSSSD